MLSDTKIRVLGLDQSPLATGWAICGPLDVKPSYGLFTLPTWGEEEGRRLYDFSNWLFHLITSNNVTHVFYEAPVDIFGKGFDITSKQSMQIGAINTVCYSARVEVAEVSVNAWRSRFIGTTKPSPGLTGNAGREDLKQKAVKSCAMRGWLIEDHNVAEACGVMDFGLASLSQRYAGKSDIIFHRIDLQRSAAQFRGEL